MKFNLNYGAMFIVTLLLARMFITDVAAMYAYVQVYQDAYRAIVMATVAEAALSLAATIIAAYYTWKVRA
jgi:hypothetical protein